MQLINDLKRHNSQIQTELREAVSDVLDSGWFALGPQVSSFEEEFAEYCEVSHCIGVANGTDALEIALRSVGISAGDEVIVAANAGMYSTTAILAVGAQPVYADVSENSFLMTTASFEAVVSEATRAVIVTHLFGQIADIDEIVALANKRDIKVLEDCAQAHGAKYQNKRAGSFGHVAAFSFYPTKNLGAIGDGGAVVTKDAAIAANCRSLRQYGWLDKYKVGLAGGRNSRLDELQAAVLRVKLRHLDNWNLQRRHIASIYASELDHPDIKKPVGSGPEHVYHLYVVQTAYRDSLREFLTLHKIGNDIHYPVLDKDQPVFGDAYSSVKLPRSESLVNRVLSIPCFPELDLVALRKGIATINSWRPASGAAANSDS